jgi:hypothetical protein
MAFDWKDILFLPVDGSRRRNIMKWGLAIIALILLFEPKGMEMSKVLGGILTVKIAIAIVLGVFVIWLHDRVRGI